MPLYRQETTEVLDLLRLVPSGHLWQFHDVTFGHNVPQYIVSGIKCLLAAVAAALVDLSPDEVHQFYLLIELKV